MSTHLVVVEVQAGDRVRRLRLRRLLLEADARARARRTRRRRSAPGRAPDSRRPSRRVSRAAALPQVVGEMRAVEDVVAEHQRHAIAADELAADDERLREALRARLQRRTRSAVRCRIRRRAAAGSPPARAGVVMTRIVADAREHQRRQRVVHHRLVVDRHAAAC